MNKGSARMGEDPREPQGKGLEVGGASTARAGPWRRGRQEFRFVSQA